jgi:EmrB/QacA subfamily drug resistance transporter
LELGDSTARVKPRAVAGLVVVGLGTITAPLDSSVNIAFPFITRAFDAPLDMIQWIVICYVLTYSSLMLVFGKLGDLFGYRLIFGIGLLLSTIAFALCSLAETFSALLIFRVVQGLGAALVISCGPALATMLFPESLRGRVLGIYTMMFGIGGALGPSLGGILIAEWGWGAVFWFRAPVAAVAAMFLFLLPSARQTMHARSFDFAGAILLVTGLSTCLLAVNQARHAGGDGALMPILLAAVAVASLVGFIVQERRTPEPILRPGLFRNAEFALVNVTNTAVNLVGFAVMFLVPYFLDRMTGMPVVLAGAVLAMSPAGMVLAGPAGGWLLGRVAAPRLALAGAVMVGVALLAIGRWDQTTPVAAMGAGLVAVGLGLGLFQVAYMHIVTGTLPPGDRGVAGSLAMVTRTIGVVSGATGLALAFAGFTPSEEVTGPSAFLIPFTATFTAAGASLLVFLGLTFVRPSTWRGAP